MKDCFYGDNRDVFKWSWLTSKALDHGLSHIVQVTMKTRGASTDGNVMRPLTWREEEPRTAKAVASFFERERGVENCFPRGRAVERIRALTEMVQGVSIELMPELFSRESRREYFQVVEQRVRAVERPFLAFLDPDNGLAPEDPDEKHVRDSEIRLVYQSMCAGSILSVIQFNPRRDDWMMQKFKQFAGAVGDSKAKWDVKTLGRELVLFFAEKPQDVGA